jgi:phosphoenolpyruvate phosphomutase
MYYATPTEKFREAGISMVIWANHNLRAAITAMREVSRRIHEEESLTGVEDAISSVKEVFEIADDSELQEAEKRYLTTPRAKTNAVVLAASRGRKLGDLTEDRPKCMVDVRGQPLLRRLVSTMRENGVRDITVVRGYMKEAIDLPAIRTADNDAYETTGEATSLACALDHVEGDCLVSYGDILYRGYILANLLEAPGDIVLVADTLWHEREGTAASRQTDRVSCSRPFTGGYLDEEPVRLLGIGADLTPDQVHGQWIGLVRLSAKGSEAIHEEIEAMRAEGSLDSASMPDLLARLVARGQRIDIAYIAGHWLDVNDAFDLAKARNFL